MTCKNTILRNIAQVSFLFLLLIRPRIRLASERVGAMADSLRVRRPSAVEPGEGLNPHGNRGPPPALSSGASRSKPTNEAQSQSQAQARGGATARRQSEVGSKLLKKRQSVLGAPHFSSHVEPVPAMPAMPSVIPPAQYPSRNIPSSNQTTAKENGVTPTTARTVSPAPSQPNNAELGLMATGLDIEMLAGETFKTEECTFFPSL